MGLAAALLLLGGCSGGNPDVQVYYTPESQSFESEFYPAAVPAEGGVLLRTLDRVEYNGEGTHPNNLYLWRGDSVAKYEPDGRLAGLSDREGGLLLLAGLGGKRRLPVYAGNRGVGAALPAGGGGEDPVLLGA